MSEQSSSEHPFDNAIALHGNASNGIAEVSRHYQNMVGPFGGVTAATILNAVIRHPECEGVVVSLTVNFLGPIQSGKLELYPRLLRTNRSNQHWSVELKQGTEIQCSAMLVFAKRRETWEGTEIECPDAPSYHELKPFASANMPPWVGQYDMRFVTGNPFCQATPNSKQSPSESLLWMSDTKARVVDVLSLTAMCDAFFPRFFVRTKTFGPVGTISFTVYFHVSPDYLAEQNSTRVLGHARASNFYGSYFDQHAEVWGENKKLLATTSQVVYYKG